MPLLDSVRDEFAEHNVPLHLLLGLISFARRMDAHLPGSPGEGPPAPQAPPAAAEAPRGDPFLHLLLGLVSLRRTLLSELEPLREAHEVARARRGGEAPGGEAPGARTTVPLPPGGLLR